MHSPHRDVNRTRTASPIRKPAAKTGAALATRSSPRRAPLQTPIRHSTNVMATVDKHAGEPATKDNASSSRQATTSSSSSSNKTNISNNSSKSSSNASKQNASAAKKPTSLYALLNITKPSRKPELDRRDLFSRSQSAQSHLDTIGKDWLNAPRTKTLKKKESYDRFIPDRGSMDLTSAQFHLNNKQGSPYLDRGSLTYQEQVAEACGIVPNQRILAFRPQPPAANKEDVRKNMDYSMKTTVAPSAQRRIMTAPEKILDAPFMADDFYLNLLDWSNQNVVAIGLDRSVYLWNADNGTIKALNYVGDDSIAALSWSADGSYLALGTGSGDTQIWDAEANTKLRSMPGHQCRVNVASWDKHLVSTGARDGSIWHHDVRISQHKVMELSGHEDEVCGLKWRWDGTMLASGGNDNTVHLWDARSAVPKFSKRNHSAAVKALAWCPWNHNLLATGGGRGDKHIHFWNTTTTSRVHSILTGSQVTSLHWSRHYKEIVSSHGYPHNQLTVWGYPTLNKIVDIPGHDSRILHTAMSPDGQVIATAAADENLKFWRVFEHDGKELLANRNERRDAHSLLKRSNSLR